MDENELRQAARIGALEMCKRAITEFPDLLHDLNAMTIQAHVTPFGYEPTNGARAIVPAEAAVVQRIFRRRKPWKPEQKQRLAKAMKRAWRQRKAATR